MSINLARIRDVYEDNDEIASWCDRSTYVGAETYTHLMGLYEAAVRAGDEIARLREENRFLRQVLCFVADDPFSDLEGLREYARAALKENSDE